MNARFANDDPWKLDAAVGTLHSAALSARLDLARPDLGIQAMRIDDRDLPGQMLTVRRESEKCDWPLPVIDAYVRGNDLVASYEPIDDWPYSPQLYWSASPLKGVDGIVGALSLLVSVQTHLLDTWPRIKVSSHLPCEELMHVRPDGSTEALAQNDTLQPSIAPCCILYRPAELSLSYVEIMPATDFRDVTVRKDEIAGKYAEWTLFSDFLEKGVIRRSLLHGVFTPRENDAQIASKSCEAIERSPLPLTT